MTVPMNVLAYCASEVQRQGDDAMHVFYMAQAWERACRCGYVILAQDVMEIASLVKGNALAPGYRRTPVSFRDGSLGADWNMVPHMMERLLSFQHDATPDEFAKQFLDIHPFEDGNGRTASLLWNFQNGNLWVPEPLPYFYGDA